jgi:hypothetical protein
VRTAFVAMKFRAPADRDTVYIRIKEVLLECGYRALRADEIPSSGVVVDEVCRLLQSADLVVLDSTGDSHSVSYEIGYCHGVGRTPEATLLVRKGTDIPFNYRHFRHRTYRSNDGLQKEIREFLGFSPPISDHEFSYVVSFSVATSKRVQSELLSEALIATALHFELTARLESYVRDGFIDVQVIGDFALEVTTRRTQSNQPRVFSVGIAIKPRKGRAQHRLVRDFSDYFAQQMEARDPTLKAEPALSEGGTLYSMRASLARFGHADFVDGTLVRAIYPQSNPLAKDESA